MNKAIALNDLTKDGYEAFSSISFQGNERLKRRKSAFRSVLRCEAVGVPEENIREEKWIINKLSYHLLTELPLQLYTHLKLKIGKLGIFLTKKTIDFCAVNLRKILKAFCKMKEEGYVLKHE